MSLLKLCLVVGLPLIQGVLAKTAVLDVRLQFPSAFGAFLVTNSCSLRTSIFLMRYPALDIIQAATSSTTRY